MASGAGAQDHPTIAPGAGILPKDSAALQAMIRGPRAEIAGTAAANRADEALVQARKIAIARLREQRLGARAQKIERATGRTELALERPETARAAVERAPEADTPETCAAASRASPMTRRARPSCSTRSSAAPIAAARLAAGGRG